MSTYGGGTSGYDSGTGPYQTGGEPYGDPYDSGGSAAAGGYASGGSVGDAMAGGGATLGGATAAGAAGASAVTADRPDVEGQSVGDLVGQLTTDFTTLMRQEVALAKAELREEAKKAGKAAGMLGAAGLAGYFVLLFLSLTLMWLLGEIIPLWVAALIVTILWAAVGFALFTMGRKQMKEVNPKPEQTVESLKEDKEWVKAQRS